MDVVKDLEPDLHGLLMVAQRLLVLALAACPDPGVYERANYMMILQSWRAEALPTGGGEAS